MTTAALKQRILELEAASTWTWRKDIDANDAPCWVLELPRCDGVCKNAYGYIQQFKHWRTWPPDVEDETLEGWDIDTWTESYQCLIGPKGKQVGPHQLRFGMGRLPENVPCMDLEKAKRVIEAAMRKRGLMRPMDIVRDES